MKFINSILKMRKKDYVLFGGIKIPPAKLRPGGPRYSANKYF